MIEPSTKGVVENFIKTLLMSGRRVASEKWQACHEKNVGFYDMLEICDLFARMRITENSKQLAEDIGADLPWADDHFMERVSGIPSNPGKEYANWPYWKVDGKYMQGQIFSHTYQERFWPPSKTGIRYKAGDLSDIVQRLSKDKTTRQAFLSIWHPEDQSNNDVRVPCTIGYWFKIQDDLLNITYLIRSCDARRHLRNDVYMTQRLAKYVMEYLNCNGHKIGLGIMSMWIGSLHCFDSDILYLKKKVKW